MIKSTGPKVISERMAAAYQNSLMNYRDYSGTAAAVRDYELKLEARLNVKHVIAVSSGTAAIHAGLVALGVGKGSRVAVPAVCAVMTVLPVLQLGATPVVIDTDGDSFCLDPEQLESELNNGLAAIIACGMWGNPGTSETMLLLSRRFNVPLLEDAAQSFGASTPYGQEGLKGHLGCFSTHEYKLLSTGEGGFVSTNDTDLAERLRAFIRLGFDGNGYGNQFGVNYKLSGYQAIAGLHSLTGLDNYLSSREALCSAWLESLSLLPQLKSLPVADNGKVAPYACAMQFNDNTDGLHFAAELAALGLLTDPYRYELKPITCYPVFAEYHPGDDKLPKAMKFIRRLLILPVHDNIKSADIAEGSRLISSLIKG